MINSNYTGTENKSYHMVFHEHLTSVLEAAGFSMKYLISSAQLLLPCFPKDSTE